MIRVHELSKRFGDLLALDRLDFELPRGEILGLLGPNGAGKTTTLRILTGFLAPDSGRVELDGEDLFALGAELRRRTGYLPESNPLDLELSISDCLDFHGGLYGLGGATLSAAKARVLGQCGLTGQERRPVRELSKGTRQRLGLAQALLHDPEILFLDEPTAGLDPLLIRELRELIRGFAGERTVVLSTHVLSEVEAVCDRVLILHRGRAVLEGELGALSAGAGALELRADFGDAVPDWESSGLVAAWRRLEPGPPALWSLTLKPEVDAAAAVPAICEWAVVRGARVHALGPGRRSLEELFVQVVMGEDPS